MKQIIKKIVKPLKKIILIPFKIYYKMNFMNAKESWSSIIYDSSKPDFLSNLKRYAVSEIYYSELSENEKLEFNKKYVWGRYAKSWHDDKARQYEDKILFEQEFIFWRKPLVMAIQEREREGISK